MEDSDYQEIAAAEGHEAAVDQDSTASPEPPPAAPTSDNADSGDGRSLRARKAAVAKSATPPGHSAAAGLRRAYPGPGPGPGRAR